MPKCAFSGKEIPPGRGIMYVKKDGKVLWFLNSKSEKNYLKLGRKPRNVAWTAEARSQKVAVKATEKRASQASKKEASQKGVPKKEALKKEMPKKEAKQASPAKHPPVKKRVQKTSSEESAKKRVSQHD